MIHKNRKLLSLFMILCMVFTLLPFNNMRVLASGTGVDNSEERISEARAVSGTAITMTSSTDEVFYDLWVGGVQVTSANKDNITGVGIKSVADTDGKVSYDPEQNILTLNNVIITVYSSLNGFYANICSRGPLNIELTGNNKISNSKSNGGIYVEGNLTISGDGALEMIGYLVQRCIYAKDGDVDIVGGELTLTGTDYGIYADNDFIMSNGSVSLSVTSEKYSTVGIKCKDINISGGSVSLSVTSIERSVNGIQCDNANISRGTLYITMNTNTNLQYNNYCLAANNGINITDGTVTVNAETTTSQSTTIIGMITWGGDINISGGNVNVTVKSASTASASHAIAGIYPLYDYINISGGEVTVISIGDNAKSIHRFVKFTNGITKGSTSSEGIPEEELIQGIYQNPSLKGYKYIHYEYNADVALITQAKEAIVGGTVTVAYGADQTAKTAAVQSYVNSLLTGDTEEVTAVVTLSSGNIYNVELSKGSVIDSKNITMTINESENPDIVKVNAAKSLIEGASYTIAQTAANTVDSVKEELVRQIENLSGMSATGVVVTATNITVSDFVAATAGTNTNFAGTNGSFNFIVSLSKGEVNNTTISKTGTITATTYTGTPTNPTEPIGPSGPPAQPPVDVPTPSPTPQNNSGISVVIPKKDGQENIDITTVTTEQKDDQVIVTIKAEDIMSELEKEDEPGVHLDLIISGQEDDSDQPEINIILKFR